MRIKLSLAAFALATLSCLTRTGGTSTPTSVDVPVGVPVVASGTPTAASAPSIDAEYRRAAIATPTATVGAKRRSKTQPTETSSETK